MAPKVSASGTSFGEHFIAAVFEKASCDVKMRSLDLGFEIDVLIEDLKLGIEYGAWYWHADKTDKDKKKISQAKEQGYTIYCIYDDVPQDVKPSSVVHAYCLDKGTTPRDIEAIKPVLWNILVQYNLVSGNAADFDWEDCVQSANFNRQQMPVPFERSLAALPEIAADWDIEKNNGIRPEDVFAHSSARYWWVCSKGHSYLMTLSDRTTRCGCPICANRRLSSNYNSFAAQYPHLLDYWDFEENPESPYEIFPTEYIKQDWRWKCPVCGYKWSTVAAQPVLYAEAELCPQCRQAARLDEVLDDIHIATRRSSIVISPSIARFSSVRYSSPEREQIETLVRKTLREHLDAVSADADYWYVETDYLFCRISKVNVQAIQEFYLVEPEQSLGEKVYLDKRFCWWFPSLGDIDEHSFAHTHPRAAKYWDEDKMGLPAAAAPNSDHSFGRWHWKCPDCGDEWSTTIPMAEHSRFFCRSCCIREKISVFVDEASKHYLRFSADRRLPNDFPDDFPVHSVDELVALIRASIAARCDVDMAGEEIFLSLADTNWQLVLLKSGAIKDFGRIEGSSTSPTVVDDAAADLLPAASKRQSFAERFPDLLALWDWERNEESPYEIPPTTNKKKEWHWVCPVCGERWETASSQKLAYETREHCPKCRQANKLAGVVDEISTTSKTKIEVADGVLDELKERFCGTSIEDTVSLYVREVVSGGDYKLSYDAKMWYLDTARASIGVSKTTHQHSIRFLYMRNSFCLGCAASTALDDSGGK